MYQKRMMRAYDKKVHPHQFREGDLVVKQILLIHKDVRKKQTLNQEGPYIVKRVFSGEALILTKMDGNDLPNPINSDFVKKYYA